MKRITDKERLDFVTEYRASVFVCGTRWSWWNGNDWIGEEPSGNPLSPRQAIDAAIRRERR